MVKKRYIFSVLFVSILGVLAVGIFLYVKIANKSDDYEVVFAATEVGTPIGDKVTKDIGPAGGTLASADGRLTLTVPQNALTETVTFGIQPVTNKFGGGLGLAYRLEPETKTFTTPLEFSIHYDDHDLEGTFPEALSLAYQDDKGAWHMQKEIDLAKDKKTVSVSTTHFSIWSETDTLKLSPAKATVRVGETVSLSLTDCNESLIGGVLEKMLRLMPAGPLRGDCSRPGNWKGSWELKGEGKLAENPHQLESFSSMVYTAPGKKPSPNVATVVVYKPEFTVLVERPCTDNDVGGPKGKNLERLVFPKKCYDRVPGPQSVKAVITIIDQGYKASGQDGPTSYSGVICDLEKPFTVLGHNGPLLYTDQFTPSSGLAGTASLSGQLSGVRWAGGGPYTIEGIDTDKPRILFEVSTSARGGGIGSSGMGTAHIDLIPLTGNECGGG